MIKHQIAELRTSIPIAEKISNNIDIQHWLNTLLHNDTWSENDKENFLSFLHKVDISRQVKTHYSLNWKKSEPASPLSEPWFSITALLLCKLIEQEQSLDAKLWQQLKKMNTLLKLLDQTSEPWLSRDSSIRHHINKQFDSLIAKAPFNNQDTSLSTDEFFTSSSKPKNTIPLTILYWEGPIARAYLETIYSLGFAPEKIIHLIPSLDVATKKPIARWLPKILKEAYASSLHTSKMNYWPKQIIKNSFSLYKSITDEVHTSFGFPHSVLSGAQELKNLNFYCNDVEPLLIEGLNDPTLEKRLNTFSKKTFLYTGGGIIPESLLSIPQHRFVHIHPGFLPDIRGADCALWSSLIAGRTSATCFYMEPGIDTGDIIFPCWLPKVQFNVNTESLDLKTMYRAIYGFFDPWVRSYVLRYIVCKYKEFDDMPATAQDQSNGTTYHFMHSLLQKCSFEKLFCDPQTNQ